MPLQMLWDVKLPTFPVLIHKKNLPCASGVRAVGPSYMHTV